VGQVSEYSPNLLTSILKMMAACTFEAWFKLPLFTHWKNPKVESIKHVFIPEI
jgi:hypothetical protein